MSDPYVDSLMTDVAAEVAAAMDEIGPDIVADIRQTISVPIEPPIPIRSAPGEPPRLETGRLRSTVAHTVTQSAPDVVDLTVSAGGDSQSGGPTASYAESLEYGRTRMAARPFMGPAEKRWEAKVEQRLAAHFAADKSKPAAP